MAFELRCKTCFELYTTNDNVSLLYFLCPTCREEVELFGPNEHKIEPKRREKFQENILTHIRKTGIGPRHENASLEDFESGKCKTEISGWLAGNMTEPIMIQSEKVGNGKTHLACAILREWMIKRIDTNAIFIPAVDMLLALRGSFESESEGEREAALIRTWSETGLLVIDDLGAEKASEYGRQAMYQVVNRRYMHLMPTIITSNASTAEITEKNGAPFMSRVSCGLVILPDGSDLRAKFRTIVKVS